MKMSFAASALLLFLLALVAGAVQQSCPPDKPNMFIAYHSHLDAFWLKTEDELRSINFIPDSWFYSVANQRNSKQVFNAMFEALSKSSARRYFISEVFFFRDWYEYLSEANKDAVKGMLRSGQLEIVNSGWVENDEAVCYYDDIIEQYTVGMNYMHNEFAYKAKLGWATDSFGHSHSQAALLNELGIEMQVIERSDGRYIYHHDGGPLLEWYWLTRSDSNNATYGGLMTNLRHWPHEPSNMRTRTDGTAAEEIRLVLPLMTKLYKKNLLFKFYGDDFEEILPSEFENLEKGMEVVNKQHNCSAAHYGNPTQYLEELKKFFSTTEVPTRYYDLMPNYDMGSYWAGYYTTYPELKKLCKDSSRLLNLYKKALLGTLNAKDTVVFSDLHAQLEPMQQLVALMQHHDGITATSKHHVMLDMINKLKKSNDNLLKQFRKQFNIGNAVECRLFETNNQCVLLDNVGDSVQLTVFHMGTARNERIEIKLPMKRYFKTDDGSTSEIFCLEKEADCRLLVKMALRPPHTTLLLKQVQLDAIKGEIVSPTSEWKGSYEWASFRVVDKIQLQLDFELHFIKLGYFMSSAESSSRKGYFYDKVGSQQIQSGTISSGFYLLANNGVLQDYGNAIKDIKVLRGSHWAKLLVSFNQNIRTTITIAKEEVGLFDVLSDFAPIAKNADYYLRVESDVQSPDSEFYHDSNGYLVIKRRLDQRPDFKFEIDDGDSINANTYPVTNFAYIRNAMGKLVVSNDRAQGVALQANNSLLINLDRYTAEDRRGAGEGYTYIIRGFYRHRITVTGPTSDIERQWQKQHDEALLGFYESKKSSQREMEPAIQPTLHSQYLKLTTAFLTENTIVVRLQNMAEYTSLAVQLMKSPTELNLPDFGLGLQVAKIEQAYHNGLPLTSRHKWIDLPLGENVDIHRNSFDGREVQLKPLQIRSFRVELAKPKSSNLQKEP